MKTTEPNVLFIVIDGMTREKFSSNQKTCKTPNIDSLIKKGTYFTQAISSGSVTVPSMAGIFSSLYPFECLTLDNNLIRFNSNLNNFPKYFSEKNYFTIATIPESFSHTGFNEIFQQIDEYTYPSTLFDGLGNKILKTISESKEPWLYYVHLSDLHNEIDFQSIEELKKFDNSIFGDNNIERMISAFDSWLGIFFDKINLKNTLIIITSDHGHEGLSYNSNMKKFGLNYNSEPYEPGKFITLGHKVVEKFPDKLNPLRKKLSSAYKERRKKIEDDVKNPIIEKIENSNLAPHEKRILKNDVNYVSHVYDERFLVPLLFVGLNIPLNKKISQQVRGIDIFPTICDVIDMSINFNSLFFATIFPRVVFPAAIIPNKTRFFFTINLNFNFDFSQFCLIFRV